MRRRVIYGVLAIVWCAIAGWQALEHQWAWAYAKKSLASRAHDLSAAFSVVIRSQGRIALIPKRQLEAALDELARSTELVSVVLLSESGEVSASAGHPLAVDIDRLRTDHEYWSKDTASFANLVALGLGTEGPDGRAALLPLEGGPGDREGGDGGGPMRELRGGGPAGGFGGGAANGGPHGAPHGGPYGGPGGPGEAKTPENFLQSGFFDSVLDEAKRKTLLDMMGDKPLTSEQVETIVGFFPAAVIGEHRRETLRRTLLGRPFDRAMLEDTLMTIAGALHKPGPPPDQPPWMSKEEYERLVAENGVHWFLVTIPTKAIFSEMAYDLKLRVLFSGIALLACLALALAWRASERSQELRLQLVRARETTSRLRELNLTAAGLVHETKNPLNLIRGLAQMISREVNLTGTVRDTAMKITEETDRVAGRLNEFLDYARPVQPRLQDVGLNALVRSVFDVLSGDCEEKTVALVIEGPVVRVRADENMLRQVLFNLLINAVQAVPQGGRVEVRLATEPDGRVTLDVIDDGPGVPAELREEVFRPYFTTSENGTGLGLAVVCQIAYAHNWDVACLAGENGAVFRVGGLESADAHSQGSRT